MTATTKTKGRPRDSEATRARILEAAGEEFAELGLAGARVDRIAERADVNKRMIYLHFGNKDGLFDAVVGANLTVLTEEVPFTADDLPGYAGALFDKVAANPRALRLSAWRNFERSRPSEAELTSYGAKLKKIAGAQRAGEIDPGFTPEDTLALVLGLVTSWLMAAPALKELVSGDPDSTRRLRRHRRAMVEAVRRTFEVAAD